MNFTMNLTMNPVLARFAGVASTLFAMSAPALEAKAACEPLAPTGTLAAETFVPAGAPRSIVVVGHGLNNPPRIMIDIVRDLCAGGDAVVLMRLKGHDPERPDTEIRRVSADDWLSDVERNLAYGTELAKRHGIPLRFVGYSLSALAFETFMNMHPGRFEVERAVFIAPAIGVKHYAHLIRWLPLSGRQIIASRNRADSRANSGTSLAAYRALFELRKRLFKAGFSSYKAPHLVVLSRRDELVDSVTTRKIVRKRKLTHWQLIEIEKDATGKAHSHRHLCVSRASLGEAVYADLMKSIGAFLGGKPALGSGDSGSSLKKLDAGRR